MSLQRGIDGPDPVRSDPVTRLVPVPGERRLAHRSLMATGTLACPACDAPVLPPGPLSPAQGLACPFCDHGAAAREFLSLAAPARPARVGVWVVAPALH